MRIRDIPEGELIWEGRVKWPSLRLGFGTLCAKPWRGLLVFHFYSRKPLRSDLRPYSLVMKAMNHCFKYTDPFILSEYERASKILRYMTARDVFYKMASGTLITRIETVDGKVIRPLR